MSPEWFDYTEPYLTAPPQEEQGVAGILGGSTSEPLRTSSCCSSIGMGCGVGVLQVSPEWFVVPLN